MLGVYDYTVILTYISVLSASTGIFVTLTGPGHPYIGMVFLLLCGLCDTFDGKVARTKRNRTKLQKDFGVQIDSLSDLVAFGVLPVCLGMALYRRAPKEIELFKFGKDALLALMEKLPDETNAQEYIKQHPDLARMNASSCNTIRIVTYANEQGVRVLRSYFQVGTSDTVRMGQVAFGGVCISVHADA